MSARARARARAQRVARKFGHSLMREASARKKLARGGGPYHVVRRSKTGRTQIESTWETSDDAWEHLFDICEYEYTTPEGEILCLDKTRRVLSVRKGPKSRVLQEPFVKIEDIQQTGELPGRNPMTKKTKKKKRKKAGKKSAKRKRRTGKKGGLRTVPQRDYSICWDEVQDCAHFSHKSGIGGAIGSGLCDTIGVFQKGKRIYVLSVNYNRSYAVLESFVDDSGVEHALIAGPKDIQKLFGDEFSQIPPMQIAQALVEQMECLVPA